MQEFRARNAQKHKERVDRAARRHPNTTQQEQPEPITQMDRSTETTDAAGNKHSSHDSSARTAFQADGGSSQHHNNNGTFTLLLFASAQTYANDTESLTLPAPMNLRALFQELERRYPGIGQKVLRSSGVSVNLEYVDFDWDRITSEDKKEEGVMVIRKGDEVGIIPPVSSG